MVVKAGVLHAVLPQCDHTLGVQSINDATIAKRHVWGLIEYRDCVRPAPLG